MALEEAHVKMTNEFVMFCDLQGQSLSAKALQIGKFYPLVSALDAKAANASAADA